MTGSYVTFILADTIYAFNVLQVVEILKYEKPQQLPCPDPVIAGIIRVRSKTISIINLRYKFELPDKNPDAQTKILIVEVHSKNNDHVSLLGVIADNVGQVTQLDSTDSEEVPELGHSIAARFITGIARELNNFIIILDADTIFSEHELQKIDAEIDDTKTAQYSV